MGGIKAEGMVSSRTMRNPAVTPMVGMGPQGVTADLSMAHPKQKLSPATEVGHLFTTKHLQPRVLSYRPMLWDKMQLHGAVVLILLMMTDADCDGEPFTCQLPDP